MTKSKVLLSIVMGLAILILVSSCLKEDSKIGQNSSLELRNTVPYVINGMLHFDNYSDFELYIQNLEELENDSNQVKMAYAHLGVDLTQEFLPNLTDHPVALRMEQQMSGFVSARKAEETIINNALNNGDNSVFSIVSDPFLKSALNSHYSVQIGTRIFKFFDNGGVAIVLNNDWSTYNEIKTA